VEPLPGDRQRGDTTENKPTWNPTWNLNGHPLDLAGDFLRKTNFIDKFCPQSVLKHSVDHFQGIAMKI
jgi:hypothetical protein